MKVLTSHGIWAGILYSQFLFCSVLLAQSPVSLNVNTKTPGLAIPSHFIGVSFGPSALVPNGDYHVFDSTSTQLLNIFRQLGIKYFRMGGTYADTNTAGPNNTTYIPSKQDIDAFFRFIRAAGLNDVIYSLRLENGDSVQDAIIAKHIWDNYGEYLYAFAIGNEPNLYNNGDPEITNYSTYLAKWQRFAATILDSVPGAKFGGPDNGTGGQSWAQSFANAERGSGSVKAIFSHDYVGGTSKGMTAQQMVDGMLSPTWLSSKYSSYYNTVGITALADGFPYRLTEANSYTGGNVLGGSNGFASALWILDFMYWWASHGCSGIGVHTGLANYNGIVYTDSYGNWQVYPIAYGIKAFEVGAQGSLDSIAMSNPNGLNLTAYATGNSDSLYVTVINKEHGTGAKDAEMAISGAGLSPYAVVMYMKTPDGNPTATSGMTLGGAVIADTGSWQGKWSLVDSIAGGQYYVRVPSTCAAVVKIGGTIMSINAPTPLKPSGSSGVPRRGTLTWTSSSEATAYELQIAADFAFASVVFDSIENDTSVHLSTPLVANTKYYWHVSASNSVFTSNYSFPDSFTTGIGIDGIDNFAEIVNQFALFQNYPNPFNPLTSITYFLPGDGLVTLKVYDVLGQEVATLIDSWQGAGNHETVFNAAGHASGIYFYTLKQSNNLLTRRMLFLK